MTLNAQMRFKVPTVTTHTVYRMVATIMLAQRTLKPFCPYRAPLYTNFNVSKHPRHCLILRNVS